MSRDGLIFLRALTERWPPGALAEFRVLRRGSPPLREWWSPAEVVSRWRWMHGRLAQVNAAGYDIYVGAQPRCREGGATDDVAGYAVLPLDFDPHQVDGAVPACRVLQAAGLVPGIAVATGRPRARHFYVRLDGTYSIDAARGVARALHDAAGGDPVHDPARILRLPGFTNWKTGVTARLLWAEPGVMSLAQVREVVGSRDAPQRDLDGAPIAPYTGPRPILPASLSARIRRAIIWGDLNGYDSPSERDFGVAAALARAGMSPDRIHQVFLAYPALARRKVLERQDYVTTTVERAVAVVEGA